MTEDCTRLYNITNFCFIDDKGKAAYNIINVYFIGNINCLINQVCCLQK